MKRLSKQLYEQFLIKWNHRLGKNPIFINPSIDIYIYVRIFHTNINKLNE